MIEESIKYDKTYFKELDKLVLKESNKEVKDREISFIPLTADFMFKSVMRKNPDIFQEFLIKVADINIINDSYLIFLDKELIKCNIKEKGKTLDLVVSIGDNLIINIEINRSKYEIVKTRNDFYLERLDTMQVEVADKYRNIEDKTLYQINLNAHKDEDKIKKRVIVEYDILNNKKYDDRKRKIIINLVNYKNMYYTKRKEMTYEEIFMAGLMSENYTELYTIMSEIFDSDKLNRFMESVISMSGDLEMLYEWEDRMLNEMVKEKERRLNIKEGLKEGRAKGLAEGRAEGRAEGLAEGKAEGKAEGIEQEKNNTIKAMLKNKLDYETISKVTDKTIDEIKKIEYSMKE